GETTQTISPTITANTTFSVTVTTSAGCSGSASKNVAVSSAPTPAITAPASVCANSTGNNASTSVVGGATYAWTISGGTITAGQNTNAITFSAGPSGTVQLDVTVTSGSCGGSG